MLSTQACFLTPGSQLFVREVNGSNVTVAETCTEIDECLETYHACGDPAAFGNVCVDVINDYTCKCGNFTRRGFASDPCDDLRMPHKILHNNTCEWPKQWPLNDRNYTCECDVGYYKAVSSVTGLEYCADIDDCQAVHPGYADLGGATACGHPENICIDDFRNHTCLCAPGYEYKINPATEKPECVDVDECQWNPCGTHERDGMSAERPHHCVNRNGTYDCLCAPGYRNNTVLCLMVSNSSNGTFLNATGGMMLRLLSEEMLDDEEPEDTGRTLRRLLDQIRLAGRSVVDFVSRNELATALDGVDTDSLGLSREQSATLHGRRVLSAHAASTTGAHLMSHMTTTQASDIFPMAPEPVTAILSQISLDIDVRSEDMTAHDLQQKPFFGFSVRESVAAGLQTVAVGTKRVRASMVRIEKVWFAVRSANATTPQLRNLETILNDDQSDFEVEFFSMPIRRLHPMQNTTAQNATAAAPAPTPAPPVPRRVVIKFSVLLPTADFTSAMVESHKHALSAGTWFSAQFANAFMSEFAHQISQSPDLAYIIFSIAGASVSGGVAEVRLEVSTGNSRYHIGKAEIMGAIVGQYMTVAGLVQYQTPGFNQTEHCFVGDNAERVAHVVAPIYKRLGWNLHELVSNRTAVSLKTTCTEIDECLETHHACGDPARFENPCADEIDGYSCFCGNFTQRGFVSDPCDDLRMPHKSLHNNTCEWPEQWPLNDRNYTCECDVGYYKAVSPVTGLEYCADIDDCQAVHPGYADLPAATACGHPENICIDDFRNHTCLCAPGYEYKINPATEKPECVDVDECQWNPCGTHERDGMSAERPHHCVNRNGTFECLCAPGYRNNTVLCLRPSNSSNGTFLNGTGAGGMMLRLLSEDMLEGDDASTEDSGGATLRRLLDEIRRAGRSINDFVEPGVLKSALVGLESMQSRRLFHTQSERIRIQTLDTNSLGLSMEQSATLHGRRVLSAHHAGANATTQAPTTAAPGNTIAWAPPPEGAIIPMPAEPVTAISAQIILDVEMKSDISAHDLQQKPFFGFSVRESVAAGLQTVAVGTKRVRASMVRIEKVWFAVRSANATTPQLRNLETILNDDQSDFEVEFFSMPIRRLHPNATAQNTTTTVPRLVVIKFTVLLPTADFTSAMVEAHKHALSADTYRPHFASLFQAEFGHHITTNPHLSSIIASIIGVSVTGGVAEVRLEVSSGGRRVTGGSPKPNKTKHKPKTTMHEPHDLYARVCWLCERGVQGLVLCGLSLVLVWFWGAIHSHHDDSR